MVSSIVGLAEGDKKKGLSKSQPLMFHLQDIPMSKSLVGKWWNPFAVINDSFTKPINKPDTSAFVTFFWDVYVTPFKGLSDRDQERS